MTEPVRVVLVGMPTMLRQILSELVGRAPGLSAVADLPRRRIGSPEVLRFEPDFLITGAGDSSEQEIRSLLRTRCGLRVLTLAADGTGTLHEMRPHRVPLGELSPAAVTELARGGR